MLPHLVPGPRSDQPRSHHCPLGRGLISRGQLGVPAWLVLYEPGGLIRWCCRHLVAQARDMRSADGDLTHVDGDHDDLVVTLPGVGPSRGGDDDAVDVAVVGGIQLPGRPAEDVEGEVMAAQ
jgi:hypothetical protein